jgi:uncharacterized protein with HEPN domain
MPRREETWLRDMLAAAKGAQLYVTGHDFSGFIADEMRVDATVRRLEILGEACKSISETTYQKYPAVDWRQWRRMRDRLIHVYFSVDLKAVWKIVTEDLPLLIPQLEAILETEYGPKN